MITIRMTLPRIQFRPDPNFPNVKLAIQATGEVIRNIWIQTAEAEVNRATGDYIAALTSPAAVAIDQDGMAVTITNFSKHAMIIEEGRAAFHLPSRIDWSKTKNRRVIVPFQHATPPETGEDLQDKGRTYRSVRAMMPHEIYEYASQLKPGERLTKKTPHPVHGESHPAGRFMQAAFYAPPAKPTDYAKDMTGQHDAMQKPFVSKLSHWKFSKYHGMVKTGAKGHTKYTTFRTITPESKGWNIPAQSGKYLIPKVKAKALPIITEMIRTAFLRDIEAGIRIENMDVVNLSSMR